MKLKKWLSKLLVMALIVGNLSTSAFANTTADFSDFPNNWSAPALKNAVDNNLLMGSDGKINPNDLLTRAEMAAILTRALGSTKQASLDSYSDVSDSAWYYDALSKAVASGFLNGSNNSLYPENKATRQEVFVALAQVLKLQDDPSGLNNFADKNSVADWAKGGLGALVESGYIHGDNNLINPDKPITRAEFAQVLMNISKTYINTAKEYTADVDGNIIVSVPGVTLKNMKITGDLILADGIGTGDATLNNVTVNGRLVIRGGGSDSVNVTDSKITGDVIFDNHNGTTHIVINDSNVGTVNVYSDLILDGNVENVIIRDKASVNARSGLIGSLTINENAQSSVIRVDSGAAITDAVAVGKGTSFSGSGKIDTVHADADNISVSVPQATVIAGENTTGVTAGNTELKNGATGIVNTSTDTTSKSSGSSSSGSSSYDNSSSSDDSSDSDSSIFAGGNGTAANPWQIKSAEQLSKVKNYLDKHFILTGDIDISSYENWSPIGLYDNNKIFTGTFDGNGHTISNLNSNDADGVGVGLFGLSSGTVKNLTVKNANVSGYMAVGGIIGYNLSGGVAENLTITGTGVITATDCAGGIIGGSEEATITNCSSISDSITIKVTGSNDFAEDGPFVQCDIAECGGLIVGGGFGGTISGCKAENGTVDASEAEQPVGLGSIGGCLVMMQTVKDCTAENVTIKAGNEAHAVGGLCGFAGMTDKTNPATISGCEVKNVTMNVPNATHVGGMVGTTLYYMGEETVFNISDDCSTNATITGARNDTKYKPGAVAGRATNCTIDKGINYDITFNNNSLNNMIGTAERMYESSDIPDGFENLSAWANLGEGNYESLTTYTSDSAFEIVWDDAASSDAAQYMASMFGTTVTDGDSLKVLFENMVQAPANNGENITHVEFGYDYKTINFCDENSNVIESHPYAFVESSDEIGLLSGETVYVFKADDNAGILQYVAMLKPGFDEGMDEDTIPAHFHCYYAATEGSLGTYKPDSVTLSGWMPTMLQVGDKFSNEDKIALLKCLFGIE